MFYFDMTQFIVKKLKFFLNIQLISNFNKSQNIKKFDVILTKIHHNSECVETEINDSVDKFKHFKIFNEIMMRDCGDGPQGQDVRLATS